MNTKKYKIFFIILVLFTLTSSLGANTESEQKKETTTVYVTKSGSCYHKRSCSTLSRSKTIYSMTRKEAKSKGYRACSKCKS